MLIENINTEWLKTEPKKTLGVRFIRFHVYKTSSGYALKTYLGYGNGETPNLFEHVIAYRYKPNQLKNVLVFACKEYGVDINQIIDLELYNE